MGRPGGAPIRYCPWIQWPSPSGPRWAMAAGHLWKKNDRGNRHAAKVNEASVPRRNFLACIRQNNRLSCPIPCSNNRWEHSFCWLNSCGQTQKHGDGQRLGFVRHAGSGLRRFRPSRRSSVGGKRFGARLRAADPGYKPKWPDCAARN